MNPNTSHYKYVSQWKIKGRSEKGEKYINGLEENNKITL
jgi:hypothetical protein